VGEASDGEQGIERAHELMPDVIIMDLAMPRMNGIEATRIIKSRLMTVDVIALSFQESDHARASVLQAGARAYFTKSGPLDNLLRAIREHATASSSAPQSGANGGNGGTTALPPVRPKEPRRATPTAHEDIQEDSQRSAPRTRKA